ncbi:hypothetical protein K7X08_018792 [Anisodus acutangulus]|uniref:Uncharacterized protein n=1 Tax=Anisodus acutangulus TaxID=402998 RepID=A0A9Q1R7K2_9SOLA|nr:hypothetical protein K7X08_018792 [Anisodus acutangulus]
MNNQGVFGKGPRSKKEKALGEETLCLALPVMHPSSNPSNQSSDLLSFGTAHTSPHACGFPAHAGGDMQQRRGDTQQSLCFRVSSERDFSNMSPLNDSPYTVYLEPDDADIFNELS